MPRLARVFVSSAFRGRMEDRRRIAEAAGLAGFEVSLTELLVSGSRPVREVIEAELEDCDTYVGLFGERRGTLLEAAGVPENEWRSITEWEFQRAKELGLPRLALYDAESTPPAAVQSLVSNFHHGVYAVIFRGAEELRHAVTSALSWRRPRVVLNLWREPGTQALQPASPAGTTPNPGLRGAGSVWAQLRLGWMRPALKVPDPAPAPIDVQLDPEGAALFDLFLGADQPGRVLNDAGLRLLGAKLLALLPESMQAALAQALALSKKNPRFVLPLVIRTDLPAALALPWELLHLPSCPLPVRHGQLEIVRQVRPSGPGDDPQQDGLPQREDGEFSLLGFVADPREDQQTKVDMGADGGLGVAHNLFVEKEQEALYQALEPILGLGPNGEPPQGRVVLTDTGDVEELRAALARTDRPGILHLGCHGGPVEDAVGAEPTGGRVQPSASRRAALFLEDADGRRRAVFAEELGAWTKQPGRPLELAVLSACFTSSSWAVEARRQGRRAQLSLAGSEALETTGSLTEGLLAHGIPRVLGMQTSVSDAGASRFARAFYGALAAGQDLTQALSAGRKALQEKSDQPHEWAIPALWVARDFQPLAAPPDESGLPSLGVQRPEQPFEVAGVAYLRDGYVERREFSRRVSAAWRERRLLAIHGIGGIGKSTYAARLLQRRQQQGWRILILPLGRLLPSQIFEELAQRLSVQRESHPDPEQIQRRFEQEIAARLAEQPTAVLFDNFEDNTDESGRVDEELSRDIALLASLLERPVQVRNNSSRTPPDTGSLAGGRVVLTTRYEPIWPRGLRLSVCNLPLGELSRAEARKLKIELPGLRRLVRPCDGVVGPSADALDQKRWERILDTFGGHPKALTLLADYLAADASAPLTPIDNITGAQDAVVASLQSPDQRHSQGRSLLLGHLLGNVPQAHLPALQLLALALDPLPSEPTDDAVLLLTEAGLPHPAESIRWLRSRGLLAPSLSSHSGRTGQLVHRLVATALSPKPEKGIVGAPKVLELPEAERRNFEYKLGRYYENRCYSLHDHRIASIHFAQSGAQLEALEALRGMMSKLLLKNAYKAVVEVAELARSLLLGQIPEQPLHDSMASIAIGVFDALFAMGQVSQAQAALPRVDETTDQYLRACIKLRHARLGSAGVAAFSAVEDYQTAYIIFLEGDHSIDAAIVVGELGWELAQRGLHREGIRHLVRSCRLANRNDPRTAALALGNMARVLVWRGHRLLARRLRMLAGHALSSVEDKRLLSILELDGIQADEDDLPFDVKSEAARRRLALSRQMGDRVGEGFAMGMLAQLSSKRDEEMPALEYLRAQLEHAESLDFPERKLAAHINAGNINIHFGHTKSAGKHYKEALKLAESLCDPRGIAQSLIGIVEVRWRLAGKFDRGIASRAFEVALMSGHFESIAVAAYQLGHALFHLRDPQCREVLTKGRDAAMRVGWLELAKELEFGLIQFKSNSEA